MLLQECKVNLMELKVRRHRDQKDKLSDIKKQDLLIRGKFSNKTLPRSAIYYKRLENMSIGQIQEYLILLKILLLVL